MAKIVRAIIDATDVEATAIWYGIRLARDLCLPKILLEFECVVVI